MVHNPDIDEEVLEEALYHWSDSFELDSFKKFETGRARTVFNLKTNSGRELICYLCTKEHVEQRFMVEEKLLEIVKEKTDLNVPNILYSDFSCEKIPYLYYIAEKIEGYTPADRYKYLPKNQRKQILRNLGRSMAELHENVKFENGGKLKYTKGEIKVEGDGFEGFLDDWADKWIEKLGEGRFKDLQEKARNFYEEHKDLINESQYSCIHFDMKPDNLIFKDGELEAILDWEKAISGNPEWDLQYSMIQFGAGQFESETIAEEMSKQLFKGYLEKRELSENWRRRLLYYNMIWTFKGMAQIDKIDTETEEQELEAIFREMIDKRSQNLEKAVQNHHISEI